MNLSFKEYWPDKTPTNFIQKITTGLLNNEVITISDITWTHIRMSLLLGYSSLLNYKSSDYKPKLHSIREDKTNRWKPGNKIHFIINNRTKNRFQFAPVLTVKSVQTIIIKYIHAQPNYPARSNRTLKTDYVVFIDAKPFFDSRFNSLNDSNKLLTLAQNDGFESIEQFFNWFNRDFRGKIIHWTDLKY